MVKIIIQDNPTHNISKIISQKKEKYEYYVCRNPITINGKLYLGKVKGDESLIAYLKYLDQKIDEEREHIRSEEVHPDMEIGRIKGG